MCRAGMCYGPCQRKTSVTTLEGNLSILFYSGFIRNDKWQNKESMTRVSLSSEATRRHTSHGN